MTDQLSAGERRRDAAPDGTPDVAPANASATPAPRRRRFGRVPREQRISKWDRPPEPHDWRFYVGTIGKVLIATGLLMFGFVAYQLWGTGIETAMAQHRLEDRFETLLADSDVTDAESPPAVDAPLTDATDAETPPAVDAPLTDATDAETPPAVDAPSTDATDAETPPAVDATDESVASAVDESAEDTVPPATDGPNITAGDISTAIPVTADLSDAAVEQDPIPQPVRGEPLLRLEIPAIGRDDIVVPGVGLDDLQDGPGHYPDTPLPGQLGNSAIAGHRTTYGAPFFDVDQLEPGDEIVTTLLNGDRFVYEVTSVEIVSASDYRVVTTRNPDIAELTLTSCHPKYTARDRIIVHSLLNHEKSSNVGLPTFYTLGDDTEAAPIEGDDPVLSTDIDITETDSALRELDETTTETTDDTTAGTADDDDTDDVAGTATDDDTDAVAGTAAGGDRPRPVTDEELAEARAADADPADAFGRGWFDDRDAFLQIALWGLVLILVSLLVRRVSRRYRRDSVGILVGVVPFLVALYFFYQNVNRLLPPGI